MNPEPINLGRIARLLEMDRQALIQLSGRVEQMYHRTIRQTGTKLRVIDVPNVELKTIQRALHDHVLSGLPVGAAVYGIRGKGVIANAREHLSHQFMGVLDIADCFPSITVSLICAALLRVGFDAGSARYVTRLVTLRGRLPQGPPSSPAIMNLVLAEVDTELERAAANQGCSYSRYMDDICFSGPCDTANLLRHARSVLRRHGFRTNPKKTHSWGSADPHVLTKIVVGDSLSPTREYLTALTSDIELSRPRRRPLSRSKLDGRVAWVQSLNPDLGRSVTRWIHDAERSMGTRIRS